MPHKIIILPNGDVLVEEHDGEGNRTTTTTIEKMLVEDHAPREIVIQQPSLDLANAVLKAVKKFCKEK